MAGLNLRGEFMLRTLSSMVIVLLVVGGIYCGGGVWLGIATCLSLLSLAEYYHMLGKRMKLSRGVGYICALAVLLSSAEGIRPVSIVLTLSVSVYTIFIIEIVRRQLTGNSFAVNNVGGTLSGIVFIVVPWTYIVLLRALPTGSLVLFTLFACTWGCDVMAYLVGRKFGRNKLCELVSPNKTWEGFIGGAMGSMLSCSLVIFLMKQPPYPLFIIGFVCAIAGQVGDLAESLIKRELGEKDAGHLIPGHGGVLDRFDSILINGLMTYLIFSMLL